MLQVYDKPFFGMTDFSNAEFEWHDYDKEMVDTLVREAEDHYTEDPQLSVAKYARVVQVLEREMDDGSSEALPALIEISEKFTNGELKVPCLKEDPQNKNFIPEQIELAELIFNVIAKRSN